MPTSEKEVLEQLEFVMSLRDNENTLERSMMEDYAKIGSFLTDVAACRVYLKRMNDALVPGLREAGIVEEGGDTARLKTIQHKKPKKSFLHKQQYFDRQIVKHHKVLTNFFARWEETAGFNRGVEQREGYLPPRPATLTDFVHANDFRHYLLKHGYHWKDAGVGVGHGEFTHRIHWYMIGEKQSDSNSAWLTNTPIKLFKELGMPSTINQAFVWSSSQKRVNIWDQIVDNREDNKEFPECPHRGKANHFRQPENLHEYIQGARDTPDLWALGYLIWGRTEKRHNQNEAGNNALRRQYQEYIKKNKRKLIARGFTLGDGVTPSAGTIIWK